MNALLKVASRQSAAGLMVIATLLFAAMGVCVKKASVEVGTGEVVFFRGLVGAVMMGLLAWGRQLSLATRVPGLHLWRGFAGVTALSLWFYAIGHMPLATAVTLNYMSSVWMAVFLGLRVLWNRWHGQPGKGIPRSLLIAVAVGFVGVALVLRPTLQRDQWLDGLVGLASGMLAAWAYLQVASLGRAGEPEHRVVFYFSLFGAISGLLISASTLAIGQVAWHQPSPMGWAWLLGVGAFATLAQLAMTRAYTKGHALVMASLQYLGIAHAFVLGVWIFGDPVNPLALAGMALIVLAGIAATRSSATLKA
ncbi:DMT family transporter [Aquabacterium sp.]|uniref:DMT family transporter n=1 Tax=Aquabacterium sp. TaxID=1872578 RepID=UPI003D6CE777